MTGHEIRNRFLEFFNKHNHTIISSSPLVPIDDETLLFANAGMNQFKNIFLGRETRDYKRATTCQKVVRAGGKHNDLENVGRTARHHTFFEMLGNFSFGDYFKLDAIKFAWSFLTDELKLDKSKLLVTVYKDDDEAYKIWHEVIGIPADKIFRKGEKDNFWQMGDTGPCGPCSEIFVDQGSSVGCKRDECDIDCDCDRHLEIWNLVFMQFNRDEKGNLNPLPKPSIDTGMGLERVAGIMQNVQSNYDTDLIKPIIEFIAKLANKKYGIDELDNVSMRVIADHSRSTTFLIADGVLPSNEGRGYVLRRIMRRAMRHGRLLGIDKEFFYEVCLFVVDFMKAHYTELADKKDYIKNIVNKEETTFAKTLSSGLEIINNDILPHSRLSKQISGDDIFKLYDTFGFPVDLLTDIATDNNLTLDMPRFDILMKEQQIRAKKGGLGVQANKISDILISLGSRYKTEFIGYNLADDIGYSKILSIIVNDKNVDILNPKTYADIILDKTKFYPEGGGQIGDVGMLVATDTIFIVEQTFKIGTAIIHHGYLEKGQLKLGDNLSTDVDTKLRDMTEANHTSTHLLHKALQIVLGSSVRQAGSFVTDRSLRFDFTYDKSLTEIELKEIEKIVNEEIQKSTPVIKRYMPKADAIKLGAMALFGEKYTDTVRVVSIGDYSTELCGGCHIDNTNEVIVFKIISEQSVASGVRRIEAVTSVVALEYLNNADYLRRQLALKFKVANDEILKRIEDVIDELKEKDKLIKNLGEKISSLKAKDILFNAKTVDGIKVLATRMDNISIDNMRIMIDTAKEKVGSGVVILMGVVDTKGIIIAGVTKDLTSKIKAGNIVKNIAVFTGGKGGGRDDLAQAGLADISKIDEAISKIEEFIL